MGELGLLGLRVPEAYGGQERTSSPSASRWRRSGAATSAAPTGSSSRASPARSWARSGTEAIKTRWLPPTATRRSGGRARAHRAGRRLGRRAIWPAGPSATATSYVITGEKSGISLGMAAHAAIVFARTDAAGGARGVTAFLVPLDLPGVSRSPLRDMGTHAIGARPSSPSTTCASPRPTGWARRAPASTRSCRASTTTASASRSPASASPRQSLEETMAYVKERKRVRPRPRARSRACRFPIAEAATHLEACALALLPGALAGRPRAALHQGVGDDQVVGPAAGRWTPSTSASCSTATTATPTSCRSSSACAT